MILYFMRHGRAAEAVEGGSDDERPLTGAGEAALQNAGRTWRSLNLRPDVVITSPLVRARRSAELVAEALGASPPTVDERLQPGAGWGDLARAMSEHPHARRVLFVGHEPDLSRTIALLSGASSVRMRPGGIACLEFSGTPEPGGGEIAWLLDPDLYTDANQEAYR